MSTAEQGQMADHPTGIEESCIYIKEERDLDLEAEYEQLEGFQSDVTNIKTEVVGFPEDSYPFISRIGESYVPVKKEQELDLSVEIGQLKGPRKRLETLYPASDPNLPQPEPSPRQSEPLFLPGPPPPKAVRVYTDEEAKTGKGDQYQEPDYMKPGPSSAPQPTMSGQVPSDLPKEFSVLGPSASQRKTSGEVPSVSDVFSGRSKLFIDDLSSVQISNLLSGDLSDFEETDDEPDIDDSETVSGEPQDIMEEDTGNLTARGSSKNSSSRGLAKQKLCKPEDGASHKKKKARAKLPRLPKANIKKNKNSNLNQEIHSKRTSDPHQKSKKSKLCIANDSLKTINELLWESIRMRSGRSDEYYDKLFLMSLYSHVQNIPENKKLHAKAELLQVLAKYNDPHLGTTTPS